MIAGQARGKSLRSPSSPLVRPTGDKVKGAIFSLLEALAFKLGFGEATSEDDDRFAAARAWPRVLDLYAGSGALGIEALSRGAQDVHFVESDASARRAITANLAHTGLADRAVVHGLKAERAASTLAGVYDLILADPPYDEPEARDVLASIAASERVTDRSVLVWEHRDSPGQPERLGKLVLQRTRRHGIASISLYVGAASRTDLAEGAVSEQSSTTD